MKPTLSLTDANQVPRLIDATLMANRENSSPKPNLYPEAR